ncbi:hypothetical protein RclHR1_05760008 [Rhizophagus clarus]|uniref:BTB domain-containing protein n=1 Tax=Rhizophagus clarus TaxID=94130 RepID=A0A2Z6S602_9GLOM|nr:hypothetical protein RclHR1_05760008 [Rhizophagus clarus]GES81776.1 hypothetical protein GLOIN_2v1878318 [Rhizophagus clarus]
MTSKFHAGLIKDISSILNDADDFNVTIKVGEYENTKEFQAHSVILRARCPYFKTAPSKGRITKKNNKMEFDKPNITPTVFEMVLKYIYTGELDLEKYPDENILELLVASDELLLEELFIHVQDYLIEKKADWIQNNFVTVLHTVFKLKGCEKLQVYCLGSICLDPLPFITSKKFPLLDKEILYGLIKRDDFPVEEGEVWDCLIKWGIEQTPGLGKKNSDRTKWSNANFQALKNTLNRFIPLIRFKEFSPAEYFDKIRPYKAIIPNNIYDEIEEFYLKSTQPKTIILTPRIKFKVEIESKLVKRRLANIIASWIERTNENSLSYKYKFEVLYRSSQDGLNINTFRTKCNGQGRCIVLVKHQQSAKIYGGYNPLGFYNYSGQWCTTVESFIFSFENSDDIQNMKISRVNTSHTNYAIYEQNVNGFNFGSSFYLQSNLYVYFNHSGYYDNNINNVLSPYLYNNFVPAEIEIFKISSY